MDLGAFVGMLFRAVGAVLAGGLFVVICLIVVFFVALLIKSMYQSLTGRKKKEDK